MLEAVWDAKEKTGMTDLERAINELQKNYERAVKIPYVSSPIAWALYKTWRMEDTRTEKERKRKEGDQSV